MIITRRRRQRERHSEASCCNTCRYQGNDDSSNSVTWSSVERQQLEDVRRAELAQEEQPQTSPNLVRHDLPSLYRTL